MLALLKAITVDLFTIPHYQNADGTINAQYGDQSHLWRLKMVTLLLMVAAATGGNIAHSFGYLGDGFATSQDVKDLRRQVDEINIGSLEQRLDRYYAALCMTPGDPNLLELIRELQSQYERIRGARYVPPSCDVLFKIK